MKTSITILTSVLLTIGVADAIIDIGFETDNESVVASGPSTHWDTDLLRVGFSGGNSNSLSIINGATVSTSGDCSIGSYSGNDNTIAVSGAGSLLETGFNLEVGRYGYENGLMISDGGVVNCQNADIGMYQQSYRNWVEVVGPGSQWNVTDWLRVGMRASDSRLVISNGAAVVSATSTVGWGNGTPYAYRNQVVITGAGSTWNSGSLVINSDIGSNNRVEILDGAVMTSTDVRVDFYHGGGGNGIKVSGQNSKLIVSNNISFHGEGDDLIIDSGGEVLTAGIGLNNYPSYSSPNIVDLNEGGRLTLGSDFDASAEGFNYNAGSTLAVQGQLSGLPTLEADRRLEAASVLGNMTVHGTYAPGTSPADSVLDGTLTLASDGTLEMELGGYLLGDEYDRLTVTGTADLDGTLDVVLIDGFTLSYGDSFVLFNWAGGLPSGQFAAITTNALTGHLEWDTSELYTTGTLFVIPEPSAAGLVIIAGLISMVYFRRLS